MIATVWLLIAMGGNGYYTVPNIVSKEECVRLAGELKAAKWGQTAMLSDGYECFPYRIQR